MLPIQKKKKKKRKNLFFFHYYYNILKVCYYLLHRNNKKMYYIMLFDPSQFNKTRFATKQKYLIQRSTLQMKASSLTLYS